MRSTNYKYYIMGLFGFLKKQPDKPDEPNQPDLPDRPYRDDGINLIYNLLFCDDVKLYKANSKLPLSYPFDILFSGTATVAELAAISGDGSADPRVRVLAYNLQRAKGQTPENKELLAVIVEVGLQGGLDVLASFRNGTARYINQTGKLLVWETTTDDKANELTHELFARSQQIVYQIGPWDQARRPHPANGNTRITFLVSDGLYFGEASSEVLFNDPMAAPALMCATQLMQYLTAKGMKK